MPDKSKNKFLIKDEYDIDLLLVEGKIDYREFSNSHKTGVKESWDEIIYVSQHPFFLHSFLMELKVEHRLRVFKEMNKLSFNDIKKLGFGGSIYNFFEYDPTHLDFRVYNQQRTRLALILDIPIVFLLKDQPTRDERCAYAFMEYRELGEKLSFKKLNDIIERPKQRTISAYILEKDSIDDGLSKLIDESLFCRLDLHKTFFIIELHPKSSLDMSIMLMRKINEMFNHMITHAISYVPYLRDTYKVCLIGVYIKEQIKDANEYSEHLLKYKGGIQLYPFNFNID